MFNITNQVNDNLSSLGMLVAFKQKLWSAKVASNKAARDAAHANHVKDLSALNATKNLLAGADSEYRAVRSAIAQANTTWRKHTAPWPVTTGTRFLTNTAYFDFVGEMGKAEAKVQEAIETFLDSYEQRVQEAQRALADLANAYEYPSKDSVRDKFGVSWVIMPVPRAGLLSNLPNDVTAALNDQLEDTLIESAREITTACWTELLDALGRLQTQCNNPEGKIYETAVSGVKEATTKLNRYNVGLDPQVRGIALVCEKVFGELSTEILRNSVHTRHDIGTKATAVMAKMHEITQEVG